MLEIVGLKRQHDLLAHKDNAGTMWALKDITGTCWPIVAMLELSGQERQCFLNLAVQNIKAQIVLATRLKQC
jgi:hypothetical protein